MNTGYWYLNPGSNACAAGTILCLSLLLLPAMFLNCIYFGSHLRENFKHLIPFNSYRIFRSISRTGL